MNFCAIYNTRFFTASWSMRPWKGRYVRELPQIPIFSDSASCDCMQPFCDFCELGAIICPKKSHRGGGGGEEVVLGFSVTGGGGGVLPHPHCSSTFPVFSYLSTLTMLFPLSISVCLVLAILIPLHLFPPILPIRSKMQILPLISLLWLRCVIGYSLWFLMSVPFALGSPRVVSLDPPCRYAIPSALL